RTFERLGESEQDAGRCDSAGSGARPEALRHLAIDWRMLVGAAALVAAVAVAALRQYYRKPDDPEDEERRRRSQLNQVGRIVEGLVVELVESQGAGLPSPGSETFSGRKSTAAGL